MTNVEFKWRFEFTNINKSIFLLLFFFFINESVKLRIYDKMLKNTSNDFLRNGNL